MINFLNSFMGIVTTLFIMLGSIIFLAEKLPVYGKTSTEGKVLSISNGLMYDCVKISQTTVGESVTVQLCQFGGYSGDVKVGDKVSATYLGNFKPFGNKLYIEKIK